MAKRELVVNGNVVSKSVKTRANETDKTAITCEWSFDYSNVDVRELYGPATSHFVIAVQRTFRDALANGDDPDTWTKRTFNVRELLDGKMPTVPDDVLLANLLAKAKTDPALQSIVDAFENNDNNG